MTEKTENKKQPYAATPARRVAMIVAASENDAIGLDGDMPWRLSSDLKRFKELTMGHAIIMGRKTFESIGRLLPGRTTVIVTRNPDYAFEGAVVVNSLEEALDKAKEDGKPFIVGGSQIYELAMPYVTDIYFTRVKAEIQGDTFLTCVDWDEFNESDFEEFAADAKNDFPTRYSHFARCSL